MTVPFVTPNQLDLYRDRAWSAFDLAADEDREGLVWEQGTFRSRCGTGCCYAGLLAIAENRRWLIDLDGAGRMLIDGTSLRLEEHAHLRWAHFPHEYMIAEPGDPEAFVEQVRGKRVIHVQYAAAALLGLDLDPASVSELTDDGGLFAGGNDLEDLERLITNRFGPRPAVGATDNEGA
ncbi:hypothetical protein [Nonomuraea sp. NPDC050786]|uniref:hypothetical protein n=1 Tax=Nonomuraea sp. NPDC050786 TaxID=3154840 RepID=UPI0033F455D0